MVSLIYKIQILNNKNYNQNLNIINCKHIINNKNIKSFFFVFKIETSLDNKYAINSHNIVTDIQKIIPSIFFCFFNGCKNMYVI